jgi:pimeloyl-ACP methyl ester carboxylesterase
MNWVLLRGLGREKRHWLQFPQMLKGKILCLDLPGIGDEDAATAPLTIAAHTDFLRDRFFEKRKADGPWGLLGISLGGMIALDWANRYPDDFQKLVLINTSTKDLSPLIQRLSVFSFYCLTRALAARDLRAREKAVLKMVSNIKEKDPETLDQLTAIVETKPISIANVSKQIVAATQFTCPSSVSASTLILASMKDRMVDVRCSKALAERLHAQIKFHPTAGHDLTLDDPSWVAERVNEFAAPAEEAPQPSASS